MNTSNNQNSKINSSNQQGGITAQNVTIHHHSPFSKGLGKLNLIFKNKTAKVSMLGLVVIGLAFGTNRFFKSGPANPDEVYSFLQRYFSTVNDKNTDAHDYFADEITTFYLQKNVTPDQVNKFRETSDYKDGEHNIDKGSIRLIRKAGSVSYWYFRAGFICFRPSRKEFEKANVELEFGINDDDKITSIRHLSYSDLQYTKEKPNW